MNSSPFQTTALFEHRFWLQIMGDHVRFIYNTLSPVETERAAQAAYFIATFDQLLAQARGPSPDVDMLTRSAWNLTWSLREYKLSLIRAHIAGDIRLGLPPTFLNHMVNELDKCLSILNHLLAGQAPPVHDIMCLHRVWLPDAMGHAEALAADFDPVEHRAIETAEDFGERFMRLHLKALEFQGYTRTNLTQFPALERLNRQAFNDITAFMAFLLEVRDMVARNEILSTLMPLMPDHMEREECYYLLKLAAAAGIPAVGCDPTRPRVE